MPSKMSRVTRAYLLPAFTLVGVLIVWEALYLIFQIPQFVIPAPSGIFVETWEWKYRLIGHTWVTLYETIGGFALFGWNWDSPGGHTRVPTRPSGMLFILSWSLLNRFPKSPLRLSFYWSWEPGKFRKLLLLS